MDTHAVHALIRFGLGRRGSEPLPSDPAGWLRSQVSAPDPGPPGPSLAEAFAAQVQDREDKLRRARRAGWASCSRARSTRWWPTR